MTEETAIQNMFLEKLHEALVKLPQRDSGLLRLLYFEQATVTQAAQIFRCSRKSIRNRREQALDKLRTMIGE